MEKQRHNRLIHSIRQLAASAEPRTETDQELLQRFVSQHDEAAFASVVRRHGPMVLRVALRTLQNEHDSEDVFQATFLVLSQRARTLRRPESLGSWLYGTAYRLTLKTKATAGERRKRERRVPAKYVATPLAQITVQEAQTILDEELSRLPERFRQPVVLCCLEGLARDEAARQIGCRASVLKSRLEQGRERLRQRLVARGLTLPCGFGAFLLLEGAAAATVPPALIVSTSKAAIAVSAGAAASAVVTAKIAALTDGVLKAMLTSRLRTVVAVVLVLGFLVSGGIVLSGRTKAAQGGQPPEAEAPVKAPQKQEKETAQDTKSNLEGSKAGDRKELAPGIGFRWCPAGKFKMGEGDDAIDVELSKGFWLGETEVTQGQWKKLMGTSPWSGQLGWGAPPGKNNQPPKEGPDYAASYISHDDALSFCKKLTTQEQDAGRLPKNWKYSLPTEAQWEYACRAGTKTKFSFGDDESQLSQYAWSWNPVLSPRNITGFVHEVGLKKPNAWGLRDMHGNVWEWCSDWYASKLPGGKDPAGPTIPAPPGGPPAAVVPTTPPPPDGTAGRNRVIRSGCWNEPPLGCTSANRFYSNPRLGNSVQGFRLAAVPAGQDDKKPVAEKPGEPAAKQEGEAFTAWGTEVDGLQAGLGYQPGQKRAYRHGETVPLVVRVRNVSKKIINLKYISAFFFDSPPSVTDGEGKAAPQLRLPSEGHEAEYNPKELTLAPGKDVELAEVRFELRPESESGNKRLKTLYGTGKFQIHYERVMYSSGKRDIGSILARLATGKLELEIKAEERVKAPPKDLGKIQPPGGVPLFLGRKGEAIRVDGIEKARQRLESAPAEDLEKWVAELERIIDKKLKDGVPSARQVCRTDFVIHLSVAFDDLKWNTKTADDLFKRAQTMPATEAKTWKEAFESLLKKEIGQTDSEVLDGGPEWAIPLVLIPVEALHEGLKYSAERGQKYRARLKQLTTDDVSLWKDKVDEFGGTKLDAAVNIILLDDYFENEKFQREKFTAAIAARKK